MGKASKWLISFLSGKKDKEKRSDAPPRRIEGTIVPTFVLQPPASAKVKRGWSFGKSAGRVASQTHKTSRSMDSIESGQVRVDQYQYPLVVRGHEAASVAPKDERIAAATKIQAVFRSHLARKALCALRSLVKIQALVRGFLVRKQTTATMRSMHALMNIQVRARAHRMLMTDHLNGIVSRQLLAHRKSSAEFDHRKLQLHKEQRSDSLFDETIHVSKSKSSHFLNPKVEKMEQSFTAFYSGDLSIMKQGTKYEELVYSSAQITPRNSSSVSKTRSTMALSSTIHKTDYISTESLDYTTTPTPHYMVNTESSRAKTRSQSEPKQRPKSSIKHKSKRNGSVDDGADRPIDQEPWFMKLYRSRNAFEDGEQDSASTITTQSNHSKSVLVDKVKEAYPEVKAYLTTY